METKYLWDIIDKLRDELNIASDGIIDLNDVIKELRTFSGVDELKADKMKHILAYDTLQAEYNSLKAENERLNDKDGLYDEVKELQAELENKECGCVIPKEYKQEAEEYISCNPKVKKVYFFMVADDCIGDDGYAQDWSCSVDDAVAIVHNRKEVN